MISAVFESLSGSLHDPLPEAMRSRLGLPGLKAALEGLHQPTLDDDIDLLSRRRSPYHRRFIFEEFLLLELTLALRRYRLRSADGVRFRTNSSIREQLKAILPFHPTLAQKRAFAEIVDDLKAAHPMNRLLQGDVGSGKTLVAFETIVVAVENGYQAALMVPTEILAEQHYISARRILEPLGYKVALLRKGVGKNQPELLQEVSSGTINLAIGTHALLEDGTGFSRLGLVVIDEQHRFGVMQRLRLMEKGRSPNTLVMTATPIPRTLAMTFYGDLDCFRNRRNASGPVTDPDGSHRRTATAVCRAPTGTRVGEGKTMLCRISADRRVGKSGPPLSHRRVSPSRGSIRKRACGPTAWASEGGGKRGPHARL